jgi:hypothetical protein
VFALATHWKGRGFLLFSRMYSWIALTRSRTEQKLPRRMRLRVISANQRSIWFSHEALVGVKVNVIARVCAEPLLHFRMLVRPVVVQDQVNI